MFGTPILLSILTLTQQPDRPSNEHVGGYLIIPHKGRVEAKFNAGYSMYIPAWPLLSTYPGHRFQSGLPGTWMFAQYDGKPPKDLYSDVEGGLGWWTDTRFPTTTPKFIMGGVGPNFSDIANGPAHGWGTWDAPRGLYGVAQLSNRLVFPIDGLNVKQGERGGLFGYGYLNLPLCEGRATTEGKDVPTGANSWTLFLNTKNFKGPVAFFLPNFWSHSALKEARFAGQLLDSRPAEPNRAVQMETQNTPCQMAKDAKGTWYARISPISFPLGPDGRSILIHRDTAYDRNALYNEVANWFNGGAVSKGQIHPDGEYLREFDQRGYATWQIWWNSPGQKEQKIPIDWSGFKNLKAFDAHTFGGDFTASMVTKNAGLVTLPEYYRLDNSDDPKKARWTPIEPSQVPSETKLQDIQWTRPKEPKPKPYDTPSDPASTWRKPGPVAGPFQVHLGDGSVVTYSWYRFADQPALLNSDLSRPERERLQAKIEKIHRAWSINQNYLSPPTGALASLDPAQIVKPPKGLEVGYVPIATRQELDEKR